MDSREKSSIRGYASKDAHGSGLTRRGFVGGVVTAGLGFAAAELIACVPGETSGHSANNSLPEEMPPDSVEAHPREAVPPDTEGSQVFVVQGTNGADDGVTRLITLMEANGTALYRTAATPQGLIAAHDVVILKINCQWAQRGGTNTDLLRQVVLALAAHPDGFTGEVIIADNGQAQYGTNGSGGSLSWSETNSVDQRLSALDVVNSFKEQLRIAGSLWDEFTMNPVGEFAEGDSSDGFVLEDVARATGIVVSYPKFTTEYGTQVSFSKGIWDASAARYDRDRLKVINMPVLKVHGGYQVTGAVKAYMGTTASKLTGQASHNSVGTGGMGTQLASTFMPTLNLMDMVWVGTQRGPGTRYDDATENNMIAASTDPVALDWWCTKEVLMPLVAAGGGDTARLDPEAADPGTFGYWLALSAGELQNAGFAAHRGNAVAVLFSE